MKHLTLAILLAMPGTFTAAQIGEIDVEAQKRGTQERRTRPISLGVSGGHEDDWSPADATTCWVCGGTLGALVEKNGAFHILSNNHVIGMVNSAKPGDPVGQPALLDDEDAFCGDSLDAVGHISGVRKLRFGLDAGRENRVDAAIAEIVPGTVLENGRILIIGLPGSTPAVPTLGMRVKKVGRTTGLTRGEVVGIGFTVDVVMPRECNPDTPPKGTSVFVDQVIVENGTQDNKFLSGGDSGALIVRDVGQCPAPVGLLFAGTEDGQFAVANRADVVLQELAQVNPAGPVSFVGCGAAQSATGVQEARILGLSASGVERASSLVRRDGRRFIERVQGVVGMGVGVSSKGAVAPVIRLLLDDASPEVLASLPTEMEGMAVETLFTGPIRAMHAGPSCASAAN